MSTADPSGAPPLTLDADERRAIREEVALDATALGDVETAIRGGDRAQAVGLLDVLTLHVGVLDAIGWTEQPDAPDAQPVTDVDALRRYADRRVSDLLAGLDGATAAPGTMDTALTALAALRRARETR